MSILTDLAQAWPLALIAGGVGFIATFGRDPKADEHDVSDYGEVEERAWHRGFDTARRYQPALAPARRNWPLVDRQQPATPELCSSPDCPACDDGELPPAPEGMNAGSPIFRALISEQVVAEQMREQYGTTDPDAISARFLREIATEAVAA
ncbi:MAG: hypothetical protein WA890_18560 [Micromonospora sp.]